ncbi:hypothetical protein vseg_008346 [Gypsophila vaccaria]
MSSLAAATAVNDTNSLSSPNFVYNDPDDVRQPFVLERCTRRHITDGFLCWISNSSILHAASAADKYLQSRFRTNKLGV